MIPACIFGAASGASFNPALTLALAIDGSFAWSMVPGYIIAQFAGAFVGACLVYLLFKGQFDATDDAAGQAGRILYRAVYPEPWPEYLKRSHRHLRAGLCHQGHGKCARTDGWPW